MLAALRESAAANGGTPQFYVVAREQAVAAETCKRWWQLETLPAFAAPKRRKSPNPMRQSPLDYSIREYREINEVIGEARDAGSFSGLPKLFELRRAAFERIAVEAQADRRGTKLTPEQVSARLIAAARTIPVEMAEAILAVLRERGIAA